MTDHSQENPVPVSRRQFMQLGGMTLGAWLLAACGAPPSPTTVVTPTDTASEVPESTFDLAVSQYKLLPLWDTVWEGRSESELQQTHEAIRNESWHTFGFTASPEVLNSPESVKTEVSEYFAALIEKMSTSQLPEFQTTATLIQVMRNEDPNIAQSGQIKIKFASFHSIFTNERDQKTIGTFNVIVSDGTPIHELLVNTDFFDPAYVGIVPTQPTTDAYWGLFLTHEFLGHYNLTQSIINAYVRKYPNDHLTPNTLSEMKSLLLEEQYAYWVMAGASNRIVDIYGEETARLMISNRHVDIAQAKEGIKGNFSSTPLNQLWQEIAWQSYIKNIIADSTISKTTPMNTLTLSDKYRFRKQFI